MRSYDGYRALFVLATILAHMTGTLTVRVTNNKQTSKRSNGESSSALILFFRILFFFRFRYLVCLSFAIERFLPPSSRSPRCASFIMPPVSSFFLFFVQTRCRVYHPRSLWSFFYTLLSLKHRILYFIFIILIFFYFLLPICSVSLIVFSSCCSIFAFFVELEVYILYSFLFFSYLFSYVYQVMR